MHGFFFPAIFHVFQSLWEPCAIISGVFNYSNAPKNTNGKSVDPRKISPRSSLALAQTCVSSIF